MAGTRARALVVAAVALTALASAAPAAQASPAAEVGMADDALLQYTPGAAPSVAAAWRDAGVDVVRIVARWAAVAPGVERRTPPPGFRAADHEDPDYNWSALDGAVDAVVAAGMRPMLVVTGSGPLWTSREPRRGNPRWKPDPRRFAEFATAVARRYGDRVDRYLIWNEPNQVGWLQPQATCRRKRCTPSSPHLYRSLVLAAHPALKRADPGAEVLVGQLAPIGRRATGSRSSLKPLPFLRALGCVDSRFREVFDGACARFRPVPLDGFGYHPHGKQNSPSRPNPDREEAQIADLPRLFATLDRLTARGLLETPDGGRAAVYLTEFAYQTSPPDRGEGITLGQQAQWLQQAAFLAWRHPRIRNLTHYEWHDEPVRALGPGKRAWAGWQSGLHDNAGRPKPAALVFPHPFWVDRVRGRASVRFWGQVRPGGATVVTLERRGLDGEWAPVGTVGTNPLGYWSRLLVVDEPGDWRFSYELTGPDGTAVRRASMARHVVPPGG